MYIYMIVSDLLMSEDRDWYCTQCGACDYPRGVCPDCGCDYPKIRNIMLQDDCFLFMIVLCI